MIQGDCLENRVLLGFGIIYGQVHPIHFNLMSEFAVCTSCLFVNTVPKQRVLKVTITQPGLVCAYAMSVITNCRSNGEKERWSGLYYLAGFLALITLGHSIEVKAIRAIYFSKLKVLVNWQCALLFRFVAGPSYGISDPKVLKFILITGKSLD